MLTLKIIKLKYSNDIGSILIKYICLKQVTYIAYRLGTFIDVEIIK